MFYKYRNTNLDIINVTAKTKLVFIVAGCDMIKMYYLIKFRLQNYSECECHWHTDAYTITLYHHISRAKSFCEFRICKSS
jgi:hypothetical protein